MGDTLYGQVLALHHGLGWLVNASTGLGLQRLASHLAAELKYNGNEYGLRVVTGRNDPPPAGSKMLKGRVDTTDDVNWEGAGPDWSYVQLQLARQATAAHQPIDAAVLAAALEPTRLSLVNWRDRLHDMWNVAGITTSSIASWGASKAGVRRGRRRRRGGGGGAMQLQEAEEHTPDSPLSLSLSLSLSPSPPSCPL